jgi:hypothetical protein
MSSQTIPIGKARNYLASIWFPGAFFPFLILTIQSILGKYPDDVQKVWAWFVPTVGPTLFLMLGVMGATALVSTDDKRNVNSFFLKLSVGLSVTYVIILTLTLLLEPFSTIHGITLFTMSNYWLSPIQSLAVAAITVLFTSQEKSAP